MTQKLTKKAPLSGRNTHLGVGGGQEMGREAGEEGEGRDVGSKERERKRIEGMGRGWR